uniref:Uncharacterized protein n=1 Tax=Corethron hystrix TaxID=216773 RepID=A0A7S1BU08_9STRA|mmetsp:Transcript_39598/g.92614  ORF Transcript_39598/g.92614 Transcript_39598/m.92614 type:complete len:804 (+) Transcript_39598:159-2570(+)
MNPPSRSSSASSIDAQSDESRNDSLIPIHAPAHIELIFGEIVAQCHPAPCHPAPLADAGRNSPPPHSAHSAVDRKDEVASSLCIISAGLGTVTLLCVFMRYYISGLDVSESEGPRTATEPQSPPKPPSKRSRDAQKPFVFVLNLSDSERSAVRDTLRSWNVPPHLLPTDVTSDSTTGARSRHDLYDNDGEGGIFLVTSRILIVDLLTPGTIDVKRIKCMLVARAEQVVETDPTGFVLRIYDWGCRQGPVGEVARRRRHGGFVRAFSEDAHGVTAGFAKVDKIMRACRCTRLFLYSRGQSDIADVLDIGAGGGGSESRPINVNEFYVPLSHLVKEIQTAIAACVSTCLSEIKKGTKLINFDNNITAVEDCATHHFDASIRRQLDPEWHRLTPETKQLVSDLKTLRVLFQCLIHYDAVQFWKFIQNLRSASATSRYPSMWLLTPAANLLFRRARERLYVIGRPKKTTARNPHPVGTLVPVLEENPKWGLLRRILADVRKLWDKKLRKSVSPDPSLLYEGGTRVLVMVKDDRTLDMLRQYLSEGKERTMAFRWLRYLEIFNERSRAVSKGRGGIQNLTEEARLLLEEEGRARNLLFGRASVEKNTNFRRKRDEIFDRLMRKRRKVAEERGRGSSKMRSDDIRHQTVLDGALASVQEDLAADENTNNPFRADFMGNEADTFLGKSEETDSDHIDVFQANFMDAMRIAIKTYSSLEGQDAFRLLEEIRPAFVILYDAQLAFVRALEVYASMSFDDEERPPIENDHDCLRVISLLFENSSETTNYYKMIEREQSAFESLLQHKKKICPC